MLFKRYYKTMDAKTDLFKIADQNNHLKISEHQISMT